MVIMILVLFQILIGVVDDAKQMYDDDHHHVLDVDQLHRESDERMWEDFQRLEMFEYKHPKINRKIFVVSKIMTNVLVLFE